MHVKKFSASSMQEALRLVKAEFGKDAVILASRTSRGTPLGLGIFGKPRVEVTAAVDEQTTATAPSPTAEARRKVGTARLSAPGGRGETAERLVSRVALPSAPEGLTLRRGLPPAALSQSERARRPLLDDAGAADAPPPRLQDEMSQLTGLVQEISLARRKGRRQALSQEVIARLERMGSLADASGLQRREGGAVAGGEEPAAGRQPFVQPFVTLLAEQGVEASLAEQLLERLGRAYHAHGERGWRGEAYGKAFLAQEMMRLVAVSGPIALHPKQQRVVALVGPTGVGKTTTVAKLAAEYHLQQSQRVSLITVDTFRIAAAEQLSAFAEIMGLDVAVVGNVTEFQQALRAAAGSNLVLVDTAGRSPRDDQQLEALAACVAAAPAIEVHLVLSCTTREANLHSTLRRFTRLGYSRLLFTKLDEAESFGTLLNLAVAAAKPVSYLTTGQRVPEDIEVATAERFADLILNLSGVLAAA